MKPTENPILSDFSWKVDVPSLIKEISECSNQGIYKPVLAIFARVLACLAQRASELDDPILNICMLKMKLYDVPHAQLSKTIADQLKRLEE